MKLKKTRYHFNPDNLKYERVVTPFWVKALRVFGFLSASALFGLGFLIAAYSFLDSPKEKQLKREIALYEDQLDLMGKKIDELSSVTQNLEDRDEKIYREIFGVTSIPAEVRNAGFGGVERYRKLKGMSNSERLIKTREKLDRMSKKIYIQSKSYDELVKLARQRSEFLSSIPAIQPVSNKDLRRVASGYGYRIDPIYKTTKFHQGMDFSATVGTEVYATGDGVVSDIEVKQWGFGRNIVISHGGGYQTLYAHLSRFTVKKGQKVKRGQLIGYVGSTGKSTAPHLHYEIHKGGKPVNPAAYYYNDLSPEQYEEMLRKASIINQSFD